jgi:hypothetical protein
MSPVSVLRTPLLEPIRDLFESCKRDLLVASPFMSGFGVDVLRKALEQCGSVKPTLTVLTNVSVKSLADGTLDLDALAALLGECDRRRVQNLPGLHAKVYASDNLKAIVTSANLTRNGLVANYEYGVMLLDPADVGAIVEDMVAYGALGADLRLSDLTELAERAEELRSARRMSEAELRKGKAWRDLSSKIDGLQNDLLRKRVRSQSVNAVFADTIRYVLRRGSLATKDLHARVQAIHPDMCDDSIDRVIAGVRFGKKWKHMVRNSQQSLKRRGEIEWVDGKWQLSKQQEQRP